MSTPETARSLSDARFLVALGCGLVAVGVMWLVFTLAGQPDTATGALVGGLAVTALAVVVRWRAQRRGPSADGGFGRILLGTADERDNAILTASLAWVGLAAFLANAIGLAAVALGADGSTVIGAIEAFLIAVLVGAFVAQSRRT
ncbi:hypothetical protein [Cellulomonas sp. Leaf334]|uniref:hypothetical protein n=1 Tax=Cellulomonas sp. Leaf334 TaxID=1736339 RepID=UPI0006FAAAA1|nr:hypothetical protein [Cellulomonas sp. Leaf334]KQR10509.1 hypothetical protein ASF78_17680 [Cellulomonas sp. Leaf334]